MAELPEHLRSTPAGTARVSRRVLEAHQRERVISLVTPVFAKRGYQGTTVDDLLAAGKVGVGNFYELFAGKEDCFLAAYERVLADAQERIDVATSGREDWDGRTFLGLRALIDFGLEHPLEARLALIEAQSAGAAALARHDGLLDQAVAWLRRGRDAHRAARSLPPGFERSSVSGLAFYLQQCLLDPRAHAPEKLPEEAVGLVLEPILGARALGRLRDSAAALAG